MHIKIIRTISEPPPRDYSRRESEQAKQERDAAFNALASLQVGNSIEFTGGDASRDRINGFINSLQRRGNKAKYATANIPGGVGVWRTS